MKENVPQYITKEFESLETHRTVASLFAKAVVPYQCFNTKLPGE